MRQAAPLSMTAAVAAYGSSDTQICRHSAQDRRLSGTDTLYNN